MWPFTAMQACLPNNMSELASLVWKPKIKPHKLAKFCPNLVTLLQRHFSLELHWNSAFVIQTLQGKKSYFSVDIHSKSIGSHSFIKKLNYECLLFCSIWSAKTEKFRLWQVISLCGSHSSTEVVMYLSSEFRPQKQTKIPERHWELRQT